MSNVRGRRGGLPADGRRHTGRVPRVSHTRPVHTGTRAHAPSRSAAPSRPGRRRAGRRPARTTAAGVRRRPLFTGRAVLLTALVLLLALTLAGPVRQYLAGRAELVRLAAEGRSLDQGADPAFRERQARERLTYGLPGDRLIMAIDGTAVAGDDGTLSAATAPAAKAPWYDGLMQSLSVADGDAAKSHAGGPGR